MKKKMKPEHRYMTYLTQVYQTSSRVQRSLDGSKVYNTVRLIKPQDECVAKSIKGERLEQTLTAQLTIWTAYTFTELGIVGIFNYYIKFCKNT